MHLYEPPPIAQARLSLFDLPNMGQHEVVDAECVLVLD